MLRKEDLRITRTYTLLSNALIKLMNTTPFKQITVTDICHEAMVSRTNFYDHFEDKYHLLTFGIHSMLAEATATDMSREDLEDIWLRLLRHVAEMKDFYRRVLLDDDDKTLSRIFHEGVAQDLAEHLERAKGDEIPHTTRIVISEFVAGSLVSTLRWWLKTDSLPPEELAKMIPHLLSGCEEYFRKS